MVYFEGLTPEVRENVWKVYHKTIDSVEKDVYNLKVWLSTQYHLPQILTDAQLERYLLLSKGSVEKIKPKLDMFFTMRKMFPDIFANSNPFSARMQRAQKFVQIIPVPKLTANLDRILIIKIKECDPAEVDPFIIATHLLNMGEIRIHEDMCDGHIVIIDAKHAKWAHLSKITPMFVKSLFTIGDRAMTTRVIGVHIINAPHYVDQTLLIVKSLIKPKLASRFAVHQDPESILSALDKNVLPKDYGGNERSLDELEALFYKRFEVYKEYFDERDHWVVKEELRPTKNVNSDLLGYYGNFKTLEVD